MTFSDKKTVKVGGTSRMVWVVLVAALAGSATASAATPPDRINYQGVLRDAADAPLDGEFDMVFSFWNAESAGDELLLDRHLAANLQPVTVSDGMFNVAIGSGELLDGSGPDTYATVSDVFRQHGDVWLEVRIGGETLSPRIAVAAAGYALNASHLEGQPASSFLDTSSSAQTKAGNLIVDASGLMGYGIHALGGTGGGSFRDSDGSGYAYVASGDLGIQAYGDYTGGYFADLDASGYAWVGFGDNGIKGYGNAAGGYFEDSDGSGYAWVGYGDYGIEGYGNTAGGYFQDDNGSGYAILGYGDYGIRAGGNTMGGYFDNAGTGYAYVANGEYGIRAYGNSAGGYFQDRNSDGYAYLGIANYGIHSYGATGGGYFNDTNSGTQTRTAYGSASTQGTGAKNFVQNHPSDPSRKIVYAALEGNEVGTYVRGSARLKDGVARIALDETFAWVTNPDVGLTAQITARSPGAVLYVESVGTDELVVRAVDGFDDDAAFDYMVSGLRIGFEEVPTVQPKDEGESLPIPSMARHRALLERQPDLEAFTPLERFRAMEGRAFPGKHVGGLDLSRARALVAAIHEYDPATDAVTRPEVRGALHRRTGDAGPEVSSDAESRVEASVESSRPEVRSAPVAPQFPEAPGSEPRLPSGAILFPASGSIEVGDLLTLDPERPGALCVSTTAADPGVVGVAVRPSSQGEEKTGEVAVVGSGFATIKVDAGYGSIRVGDLVTSSPTPGHAMLALSAEPGRIVGKALEPLDAGTGTIRILLIAR